MTRQADAFWRWFEGRIDSLPEVEIVRPPTTLTAFYWHYVRQIWPWIAVIMTVGLIVAIIEVSLFAFLGSLVDRVRTAEDPSRFFIDNGPALVGMAIVAVLLRPIFVGLHATIANLTIIPSFTNSIRWQTHRYVLRQSMVYFQNDFAGRIATKVVQTGPALRHSVEQSVDALWFVLLYTVSAVVLFAQADVRLMLPVLVWAACFIALLAYFVPKIKDRAAIMSEARSMLSGRIVDSYTNMLTVKLFAHAEREDAYARDALTEHIGKFHDQMRLITAMEFTVTTINGMLIAATCGLALYLWHLGGITIGAIALTTGLVIRISNMSGWVMWVVTGIFEDIGTVEDGMKTIAQANEVTDRPNAKPLVVTRGAIAYENIRFHYGKGTGVIEDLSLRIRPGEKVGLVGRSGAGKSTLVNLLLRFYDLEGGRIAIDGQDIVQVTQESLRAQIGMVTQDTSLLHRSVLDNVRYGRPDATIDEVMRAASQAHADQFITDLRDYKGRTGFDAHVGERGVKLSGGQRQRIAIARVLLKNAPILILDEATAALDSEVEAAIQEQLEGLMRDKTVIAIAHRLSTIAAMDRLVIMDRGQIVEEGSHDQLIAQGGLYAELWARQSGGFLARESEAA
ncbi:MAG: ABC transporter ATP-binding protein [Geminicoccaceae bacterium]